MAETQSTVVSRPTPTKEPKQPVKNEGNNKMPWSGTPMKNVPANWAKMFGVDINLNPNFVANNFTTFEAFTTPKIKYLSTYLSGSEPYDFSASKSLGGYNIYLPDTPVQESFTHSYNPGTSTYDSAMNSIKEKGASLMRAPVSAFTGGTEGILYDSPQLYEKTNRRKFDVDIVLIAYDNLDEDIYDVIKFFRLNSYPKKTGHRTGLIEFPSVFKIFGGVWDSFSAMTHSKDGAELNNNFYVLYQMEIQYGDKVKFLKYGYPMQASLKLHFEECVVVTQEMFTKKSVKTAVSSTSAKEDAAIPKTVAEIQKQTKIYFTTPTTEEHRIEIQKIALRMGNKTGEKYGGYIPGADIAPKPTANKTEGSPPLGAQNAILKFLKDTLVARVIKNIEKQVTDMIKSKLLALLMNNKYMKKFQTVADIDPRHRVEIKSKLKNIKYSKWVV